MQSSSTLVVPIVLWGNKCPTHCISSILLSPNQNSAVTGSYDGQICLWHFRDGVFKATPTMLFVGHTKAVKCLAWMDRDATSFFSSSEAGEMCIWDLDDSSCKEATTSPYVHTSVQVHQLAGRRSSHLFCNGCYADVLVYEGFSLQLSFRLISKISSDWITSMIVMKPAAAPDDVVVGLTISGAMKVWTISQDFNGHGKEFLFENESKQLLVRSAWTLKSCPTLPRAMLIVSRKEWHIYDAGDFSQLCTTSAPEGVNWTSGDFLNTEQAVIYASNGSAYLYRLPSNSVGNSHQYRQSPPKGTQNPAFLFGVLRVSSTAPLACEPTWTILRSKVEGGISSYPFHVRNYVFRGDARGRLSTWAVPEPSASDLGLLASKQEMPEYMPMETTVMDAEWDRLTRRLPGVIERAETVEDESAFKITASLFAPAQGRMFLGMEDGAIVMLPALQKLTSQFFIGKKASDAPVYRSLRGHEGKITALLYPHQDSARYDPGMLVSGGVDFTVRVWDLYQCQLQHTFVCQAGEILQLVTPPNGCNTRILSSICSIASDHSVALLSLKERKAVLMASRHVFPIQCVKWRPVDDFLLVQCTDGMVYVWQMETGHLDRVLQGGAAEEVMKAVDEDESRGVAEEIGGNATLQLLRAIKHRNMDAAKQAAKQGLKNLGGGSGGPAGTDGWNKAGFGHPLTIQPMRSNPLDQENHLLLFDVEALIYQLLMEENRTELPEAGRTTPLRTDVKLPDWKSSVIPGAASNSALTADSAKTQKHIAFATEGVSMAMEVAQLLMSVLYAWGLDPEMDKICVEKLGMLQPKQAVNYGLMSKSGYMTLLLPSSIHRRSIELPAPQERIREMVAAITRTHYSLSPTLTTVHLMALISMANTLMNIQNATFLSDYEKRRKLHKRLVRMDSKAVTSAGLPELTQGLGGYTQSEAAQTFVEHQAQIKQAWSQLTAMHCVLLSERLAQENFRPPDIELLLRRWQDRSMEIRTASQALMLSELRRMGGPGRRKLIERWAPYLPTFGENEKTAASDVRPPSATTAAPVDPANSEIGSNDDSEFEDLQNELYGAVNPNLPSVYSVEYRKKQSTAIILLGIIGAEFGNDAQSRPVANGKSVGVGEEAISVTDPMVRFVAKALSYIVVNTDERLQPFSSLRRSAVDLIGRGFTVWEPFLDVGQVLLALLKMTVDVEKPALTTSAGVPLSPSLDMARTTKQALEMIVSVRPPVFLTVINMEITRHNSLAISANTLNINLNNAIIVRAKDELLRILDLLINKHAQSVADLIVETVDIVCHCLDTGRIKSHGLFELFPSLNRFPMIAYCKQNRRIAVGSKKGGIFIYELRGMKVQSYGGHAQAVSACEFSPDGKHLATFSAREGKVLFWAIGATMFGLGSTQPRCVKTSKASVVAVQNWPDLRDAVEYKMAKLRWMNNKDVMCLLMNGKEERFSV
ncbi:hypothetical protein RvY_12991-2 [Ramazzottius varieornatus]|uniref:WD repeat-containing protein 7 n=1 Tax=Ramazzottius varieornatus TaxID=947166 RepID=A0A1D1VQF6_RAMVA|nr:hypothetical protein RvY_12991-2 [Ramazzottius varieornatus]